MLWNRQQWRARRQRSASEQSVPSAFVAPAGPEPGHDKVPSARTNVQGNGVAVRATIAFGEDEEEKHRRRYESKHEEPDEDDGEDHCVRHRASQLQPLLDLNPRLDEGQVSLDPLYHDLAALADRSVIQAACPKNPMLTADFEADPAFATCGN